jgi:hypothetical protein
MYGWSIVESFRDLFDRGQFLSNAPNLWMLLVGAAWFFEMKSRTWKLTLGDWPRTMTVFLAVLTLFATTYYPHIESRWGGGTPIPIAITLSKDFPVHAGETISCSLIDETDSGFYVIGKGDKHATFVPRNAVPFVHFSDGTEQSFFSRAPSK